MTAQPEAIQPVDSIGEELHQEVVESHVYSILDALDNQRRANQQVNRAIDEAIPYLARVEPDTIADPQFRSDLMEAKQTFQGNGGA